MILGVTGGVGVGKSTVLDILESEYGYLIIRTDDVAKKLMSKGSECLRALCECFGEDILNKNGELDKKKFSDILYSDTANRKKSDTIVHPRVWNEVIKQISEGGNSSVAVETALPSSAFYELCDRVILITAEIEIRIERLMRDRGYTREYCEKIIAAQLSDESFEKYSDCILDNSGSKEDIEKELDKLLKK